MQDPRFRNEGPQGVATVTEYLGGYAESLREALLKVSRADLEKAFAAVERVIASSRRVYVAGNGGSAAIGDHLCCDWMKGTYVAGKPTLKVHSLVSNTSLLTAIGNDFGYEKSYSAQLEMMGEKGDVAVLISSSGNSPNILAAAEAAHKKGMVVIGMSGFTGGKLKEISDVSLHVPVNNYGLAEDAHQALMHVITQFLNKTRDT